MQDLLKRLLDLINRFFNPTYQILFEEEPYLGQSALMKPNTNFLNQCAPSLVNPITELYKSIQELDQKKDINKSQLNLLLSQAYGYALKCGREIGQLVESSTNEELYTTLLEMLFPYFGYINKKRGYNLLENILDGYQVEYDPRQMLPESLQQFNIWYNSSQE